MAARYAAAPRYSDLFATEDQAGETRVSETRAGETKYGSTELEPAAMQIMLLDLEGSGIERESAGVCAGGADHGCRWLRQRG